MVPTASEVVQKAAELNPLGPEEPPSLENVPRITNETITEHREEVLKGARKYIYPLQHSKHRIIMVTSTIIVTALVSFLIYCVLGLYKLYQYNTFLYRVTQVVPFPIAHIGGSFVNYENYLFELRHYVHYYENQQQLNFGGHDKQQLIQYRNQALKDVVNNTYVKILADKNHVAVSAKEVDTRITEVRNQNRLGSNNKVFSDVLRQYFGWSITDFKRALKDQVLAEKVEAKLDTATAQRAQSAQAQLKSGANFVDLARQISDDPSKVNGGDYGFGITKNNSNVPPQVVDALFNLKTGQTSGIILASRPDISRPDTLEIVQLVNSDGTTATARHITFNLKDISTYVSDLQAKQPAKAYVKF